MPSSRTSLSAAAVLLGAAAIASATVPAATADEPPVLRLAATDRTDRYAGADRYETAAAISRATWSRDDTAVVFLATGANYPDALAMGASTDGLGPVLFVERDRIPEATRSELIRLTPCRVVAVGDTGVVQDSVLVEAGAWASPSKCQ